MVLAVGGHVLGDDAAYRTVRWTAGLAGGVGGSRQEMCGALSGGVMVIGGVYGRQLASQDGRAGSEVAARFRERFREAFGVTQCEPLYDQIHAPDGLGSCAVVVERAAQMLLEILAETGEDSN
jgi:C_GCAxxG_C_C family probable redox protein